MLRKIIGYFYHKLHDFMFWSLPSNPFYAKSFQGKKIGEGNIGDEHVSNVELDIELVNAIEKKDIPLKKIAIANSDYLNYVKASNYPDWYFGGGKNLKLNFTEKTLEHFVSLQFMELDNSKTFMDVAACNSPFYQIVEKTYNLKKSYQQDLIFSAGINGQQIGGSAASTGLPNNSVDYITLHCSLEHFEGTSDIDSFKEFQRILKPGGAVIVLPFYIAHTYTIHVDPIYNSIWRHKVDIQDSNVQLRYDSSYQYFSRHYSVDSLQKRILDNTPQLDLTIYQVTNYKEVFADSYLRFVGVFRKL